MKNFVCLFVLLGSLLGASARQKLNVFIWSEYIDPTVVSDFEKKFDCQVVVDVYEDAESMLAKVQGGGVSLYDVVVPPDHIVPAMIKLNLLAPLRHGKVPNIKHLDPTFADPPYDPGNKFTVAYQWGTVGVLARTNGVKSISRSWGLFFDPKQQPGSFLLMDSVRDSVGAALKFKGRSFNSTEPLQLKEARDLLVESKKRAIGFEGSVGAKNRVLAGDAVAAMVYSGEGVRAMNEDTNVVYFIPTEGSQIWVDNLAVLAKAPHRDLAEAFVNYILEPEVGARISSYTQYASPNQASLKFIGPGELKNPAIYPGDAVKKRLEFLHDLGGKTRLYDEVWTHVKSK